ncbi:trigger factor [Sulfurihydrogenibium azorense Az-Fu1]|jgi:trigger factor|uniref:Trigger factor n=1 Tax=Sulfurihydrogenibium azorense (strain DSM 15241 / OCM 825 / Az-Fu1) TaxID=204536 RepID=C1DTD5_SULAA|nr:trigger factor [Sulfurihydrogenibium azorense]ACN98691.1 trigger factor [Sulfurihydrogenibium azorense Az-Fu1]
MNVVVESNELVRTLTIKDEGEKVKNLVEEVVKEISKVANVPGFRKGNVPKNIVKAKYKNEIKEEVARNYVSRYLQEILEQYNLKPVTQEVYFGEVEIVNDQEITFKVSFEVAPEFELKPYEGMEVEITKLEVKDEDVEKYIQNLLERNAQYIPEDKEVEEGDKVKIKYHIVSEKGEEEEDEFETIVGSGTLRKEIEDAIKGKKVGDKVELENVPLYNEKGEEIGKAKVEIEVLEVSRKVIPEFNDEFVKKVGLGENVEEAKNKIKENLQKQVEEIKKQEAQQKILDKIASEYDFPVPNSLLELEIQNLAQRYAQQLQAYGINPNREMLEAAREGLTKTAINNIRVMFVLTKIAEKEGLTVSEDELNKEIERLAKRYNTEAEDLKQYLTERNMIEGIKSDILRQKALDMLVQKANIKEVEKQEEKQEENDG